MWEDVLKLVMAVIIGGLIGAEREFRDKAAGFRTLIFICAGSTLFTLLSQRLAGPAETARIAANIVSGIGFLGAGAILQGKGRVTGLTTASIVWLVAALGMCIAGGQYVLALVATSLAMVVLWIFPRVDKWIDRLRDSRRYQITCPLASLVEVEALLSQHGLRRRLLYRIRKGKEVSSIWEVHGRPADLERLTAQLFAHPDIRQLGT
ncbi:MAG: MgtC/SapB family protein [Chloroflexota bacterium]